MRLSRQLTLLLAILVLLLFIGTFAIALHNARTYLAAQLASHAQDAATSLGLSLTGRLADGDLALVRSSTDALFDSGDYLQVRVEDLAGEPWADRRAALQLAGVPAWFVAWIPLDTPLRQADLLQGWRRVGRVLVRSHPGHAYQQLWSTAQEALAWHVAAAVLAMLVGTIGLRLLLRPLTEVERQAEAVCNREFPIITRVPFTLEFRRVAMAMNRLSAKVRQMLADAEQLATRLREQAFLDPVTGLANRRQFMEILEHRVTDPEGMAGGLILIGLRDFKAYNQNYGYPAGDRLLTACGALLSDQLRGLGRASTAHLSGADFAVLLEDVNPPDFATAARRLAAGLAGLYGRIDLPSADVGHVGAVYFHGQDASQFLSAADAVLREARRTGANACVVSLEATDAVAERPAGVWRRELAAALAAQRLRLVRQPVLACDGRLLHREVYVRLPDPDSPQVLIPARRFLPLAEEAGLAPTLDRFVLERVLAAPDPLGEDVPVAVNLAPASLRDFALLDWLAGRLGRDSGPNLILEVSEYGATSCVDDLAAWIARLAPLGVAFTLDQFGRGFSGFEFLRGLRAGTLKVDGSFVCDLDKNPDNQFYLQVLCEIAHGLDMQVIAEAVETEAAWQLLPALGLDGGQGHWLGAPR